MKGQDKMDYQATEKLIEKTVKKTVDYLKIENQLHCSKQQEECQEKNIEPLKKDIADIKAKVSNLSLKVATIITILYGAWSFAAPIVKAQMGG